mgnify:CR=1 FL=1
MLMRWRTGRDPFWDDGQGARRARTRQRIAGSVAFAVAIVACGLTAAAWMSRLAPLFGGISFG